MTPAETAKMQALELNVLKLIKQLTDAQTRIGFLERENRQRRNEIQHVAATAVTKRG